MTPFRTPALSPQTAALVAAALREWLAERGGAWRHQDEPPPPWPWSWRTVAAVAEAADELERTAKRTAA
jgi:hypothetical protein